MKSAYELALERLEKSGIEPPREGGLPEDVRAAMAEVRQKATARLAELEILHRDGRAKGGDPAQLGEAEQEYQRERRRIEEQRDAKLERLRLQAVAATGEHQAGQPPRSPNSSR